MIINVYKIFLLLFLLYNIVLLFPYINMNLPWVYTCSPSWTPTPSHLPPRTIPLVRPNASAPSILYPASNLDWQFISYMILYMFQCHSPKSSPTPPTESKRLFYTSVSFLLSRIQGYCYHLSKFHICISILYWCFSFWLTSLCIIGSSFIHLIRTDSNVFFFNGGIILHCVYVPQLSYPFICWWTSSFLILKLIILIAG